LIDLASFGITLLRCVSPLSLLMPALYRSCKHVNIETCAYVYYWSSVDTVGTLYFRKSSLKASAASS
jgi:hypothetical protein